MNFVKNAMAMRTLAVVMSEHYVHWPTVKLHILHCLSSDRTRPPHMAVV